MLPESTVNVTVIGTTVGVGVGVPVGVGVGVGVGLGVNIGVRVGVGDGVGVGVGTNFVLTTIGSTIHAGFLFTNIMLATVLLTVIDTDALKSLRDTFSIKGVPSTTSAYIE